MRTNAAPGINKTVSFQGKMTDDQGLNVSDGSYQFEFNIYTVASGGTAVWTETVNLSVADGIFQHNLGSTVPLPGSVDFDTDNIFLGITFNSDPDGEMSPRIQLTASPYAFNSDQLDGLDASDLVQLSPSSAQTGDIDITGSITAGSIATSSLVLSDGSANTATLAVDPLAGDYVYTIPTTTGNDIFCLENLANCSGGDLLNGGNSGAVVVGSNDNTLGLEANSTTYFSLSNTGLMQAVNGGTLSVPGGNQSEQFGLGAVAVGSTSVALGYNATTGASNNNVAIGHSAAITGGNSVAVGYGTSATGTGVAVGYGADAGSTGAIAIGHISNAGFRSVAIGREAVATRGDSVAIGFGASIINAVGGGVALGAGATVTDNNQFVLGSDTMPIYNAYLGAGVTSVNAATSDIVLHATSASGTDIGGADITLAGGQGTGTGAGGAIVLQTAASGGTGSSLNPLATRMTIESDGDIAMDTDTLFVDATNNRVGIGTTDTSEGILTIDGTVPSGPLNSGLRVGVGLEDASNQQAGSYLGAWVDPSSSSTSAYYGSWSIATSNSNNLTNALMVGAAGLATYSGSGTVGGVWGLTSRVGNEGVGTITDMMGVMVQSAYNDSGTITNNTGVLIQNQTAGTNNYGLHIEGASTYALWVEDGVSRIDGDLAVDANTFFVDVSTDRIGIGTATPGVGLDIQGFPTRIWVNSSGAFSVADGGGGAVLHVDTVTYQVGIGSTGNLGAKLGVVGSADQPQLLIRANATQTNPLILFEDSVGTEVARFSAPNNTNLFLGSQTGDSGGIGIGRLALYSNTTGYSNVALGNNALTSNEGGWQNTALGFQALSSNTSGNDNVAVGFNALQDNVTGTGSVALGVGALGTNSASGQNTAVGFGAMNQSEGGFNNVAVGPVALYNVTGSANTGIGYDALSALVGGSYNVALGFESGNNLTAGDNNIIIGSNLEFANATGSNQLNIAGTLTSTDYTTGALDVSTSGAGIINIGTGTHSGAVNIGNTTSGTISITGNSNVLISGNGGGRAIAFTSLISTTYNTFQFGNTSGNPLITTGSQGGANSNTLTIRTGNSGFTSGTSGTLTLQSGAGDGTSTNSGNVVIDVGTATGTAGVVSLGSDNASAINIGTGTSTAPVAIGNLAGTAGIDLYSNSGMSFVTDSGASLSLHSNNIITAGTGTFRFDYSSGGTGVTKILETYTTGAATNSLMVRTGSSSNNDTGRLRLRTGSSDGTDDSSGDIEIQTGTGGGTNTSSGNIMIDPGSATGTAGAISIGATNASSLILGRSGMTTAVGGNLAVDTDAFYVDSVNNRVGVGTSSPLYTFHTHTGTDNNFILRNATDFVVDVGSGIGFQSVNDADNAYRGLQLEASVTAFNVNSGGNVGIGTASPDSSLHVLYGGGGLDNDIGIHIEASITSADNMLQFDSPNISTGSNFIQANQNGTSVFSVRGDGAVTVGAFAGATGTTVCRTAGGMLAACTSLAAHKNNIENLDIGGLETIMQLQARQFEWNSSGFADLGFVAEEVEAVNPLLAQYEADGNLSGVKYSQMTALLVQGVQELNVKAENNMLNLGIAQQNIEDLTSMLADYATTSSVTDLTDLYDGLVNRIDALEAGNIQNLAVTGSVTIANNLTVSGDIKVANLFVGGKLVSTGAKPQSATGEVLAGVLGASVTNEGTDTAGTVTIIAGEQSSVAGEIADITFATAFDSPPRIIISGNNSVSAKLGAYVERTASGFKIMTDEELTAGQTYSFDYVAIQSGQ